MSPLIANDLFVAHLSIYEFASSRALGQRVLDLGCGTGYGAACLAAAGAAEVVAVDIDRRSIRFARRRYRTRHLRFLVADVTTLELDRGRFDLVLSSNVFEHLTDVDRGLDSVLRHLRPGGTFLLIVPPVTDAATLAENRRNPFHRTNLHVHQWHELLAARFAEVQCYRHLPPLAADLDFTSPFRSRLKPSEFRFQPVSIEDLITHFTLGAVYACSRPGIPAGATD